MCLFVSNNNNNNNNNNNDDDDDNNNNNNNAEGLVRSFCFDGRTRLRVREQSFGEASFGGVVWHSGFALGRFLASHPHLVAGRRCVELGSGCGIGGLAAAAAGAAHVTFSDCGSLELPILRGDDVSSSSGIGGSRDGSAARWSEDMDRMQPTALLWNLRQIVDANRAAVVRRHDAEGTTTAVGRMGVARIDWHEVRDAAQAASEAAATKSKQKETEKEMAAGDAEASSAAATDSSDLLSSVLPEEALEADVVLGSDLIYFPEDIEPLAETVMQLLRRGRRRSQQWSQRRRTGGVAGGGVPEAVLMFPGPDCDRGRTHVPAFIDKLRTLGRVATEPYQLTNFQDQEVVLVRFTPQ